MRICRSTNENDAVLLYQQAYNLLPGSLSSQLDYYTSKVTAVVSVMLTTMDIQGADLSESLALFCHWHPEGAWKKRRNGDPQLALIHP